MSINPSLLKTRITLVWALAIVLTALLAGLWYILQPTLVYVIMTIDNSIGGADLNSTQTDNIVTLLTLGANIFIPIMILGLWLWAFASSHRRVWRGEEIE